MNYAKTYLFTHMKHWRYYFFCILLFLPAYVTSVFSAFFLASWGIPDPIVLVFYFVIGGSVLSVPLILINYKIARDYVRIHNKKKSISLLIAYNHFFSCLISTGFFLSISYVMTYFNN